MVFRWFFWPGCFETSLDRDAAHLPQALYRTGSQQCLCLQRPTQRHPRFRGKLMFSSVNMKHVYAVCQLDTPIYPNSLAIITETGLVVGKIDEIQKLHIRSISLPGTARRVAFQAETATYGFIVMENRPITSDLGAGGDGPQVEEDVYE